MVVWKNWWKVCPESTAEAFQQPEVQSQPLPNHLH